jgi:hypothetical protein
MPKYVVPSKSIVGKNHIACQKNPGRSHWSGRVLIGCLPYWVTSEGSAV